MSNLHKIFYALPLDVAWSSHSDDTATHCVLAVLWMT